MREFLAILIKTTQIELFLKKHNTFISEYDFEKITTRWKIILLCSVNLDPERMSGNASSCYDICQKCTDLAFCSKKIHFCTLWGLFATLLHLWHSLSKMTGLQKLHTDFLLWCYIITKSFNQLVFFYFLEWTDCRSHWSDFMQNYPQIMLFALKKWGAKKKQNKNMLTERKQDDKNTYLKFWW